MQITRKLKIASAAAFCSAMLLAPNLAVSADPEEKAIATRQGYMKLVLWEAGPLFGMAKGEMAYDAAAADAHAANLKIISQYPACPGWH